MAENSKIGNPDKSETAVEWLAEKMDKLIPPGNQILISIILAQAKQMEKEKITKAFYDGMSCGEFDGNMGRAEQYYNETYGKE